MPAGDDEIYRSLRFNRNEVDFSQWPKLSCSAANELTLATQDDPNPGFARLAIAGELKLQAGVAVNELSSDEKLTNKSDLAIPTQKAVKTYVDNQITLVNQTLSTKAALNGASSQDFQSRNLSVSGNLTANGNVSIGTTSSSYKLAIAAGDINIDDGRALRQAGRWVIGGNSNVLSIGSTDARDGRDISFDPGFAGALTIKKGTGNVGIGTTNPTYKLEIVGDVKASSIHSKPKLFSFKVEGDLDKFYPVVFRDDNWEDGPTELEINRPYVHTDSDWRGALNSRFTFHSSNGGHGADFCRAEVYYSQRQFIAGYQNYDYTSRFIVWLRGGETTYYWRSNAPITLEDYSAQKKVIEVSKEYSLRYPYTAVTYPVKTNVDS